MAEDITEDASGLISTMLNLPVGRASVAAIVVADTIGTGSLAVFLFWPSLFVELPFSKLLLLSFAITAPFIAFGAFTLQLGFNSQRRVALHEGLGPRLAAATAGHCLMCLLAMGDDGLLKFVGSAPKTPEGTFWAYSALYAYAMTVLGFYESGRKRLQALVLYLPIVAAAIYLLALPLGKHFGWWY